MGAALLSLPRWCMAAWPLWALVIGWRVPNLRPAALLLGGVGGAAAGRPELDVAGDGPGWIVVSTNVNSYSPDADTGPLEKAIAESAPDAVIVLEKRLLALAGFTRAADNFEDDLPRPSHGSAVFCRDGADCVAEVTEEFGSETMKMPLALVRLGGQVCIFGVHAPPPVPYDPSGLGPYVESLASAIDRRRVAQAWGPCQPGDAVVVVGDLNAVPGSTAWRRLVEGEGLLDARSATGVFGATWPSGGGWPDLPYFRLDHLLVGDATVSGVHSRRMPGTDHKALVFRVSP